MIIITTFDHEFLLNYKNCRAHKDMFIHVLNVALTCITINLCCMGRLLRRAGLIIFDPAMPARENVVFLFAIALCYASLIHAQSTVDIT